MEERTVSKHIEDVKVGDIFYVEQIYFNYEEVHKMRVKTVTTKYDENTGKPYTKVVLKSGWEFHSNEMNPYKPINTHLTWRECIGIVNK